MQLWPPSFFSPQIYSVSDTACCVHYYFKVQAQHLVFSLFLLLIHVFKDAACSILIHCLTEKLLGTYQNFELKGR